MEQLVNELTQYIHANQEWAGLILGLMTMGESLLILGIAIPATAIMLVVGGLIGGGAVEPLPVIIWGITGAIIGDAISYYIGRWLGPQIIHRWPLNRQKRAVARARLFFYKYGMMSIFGGRFLGPLRAIVPTVAGIMKMRHWRFQVANIASAIVWVPVMLLPGYLTGRSLGALGSNGGNASIIISSVLSVVIAVWITLAVIRKRRPRPTD
ncbi:MAG: DedA family protein [Pusillimonas sp.]|jgi:membrane protein DedA with SNARE-associated domain|nr:DedA family protein [Pusillimonas sp.]